MFEQVDERFFYQQSISMNIMLMLMKIKKIMFGIFPDNVLPEIIESKSHPWFLGVQFHPELKSRPQDPHPLFVSFINAAKEKNNERN